LARGATGAAKQQAEQALAMAQSEANAEYSAFAQLSLGAALLPLGQQAAAREAFAQARAALEAIGLAELGTEASAGIAQAWLEDAAAGGIAAASGQCHALLEHLDGGGSFAGTERPLRIWLTLLLVLHATGHARSEELRLRAAQALHTAAEVWPEGPLRERFYSAHAHHGQLRALTASAV
jgi:hypothetical protein